MPSKKTNAFRANMKRTQAVGGEWRCPKAKEPEVKPQRTTKTSRGKRPPQPEQPQPPRNSTRTLFSASFAEEEAERTERLKAEARKYWQDILGPI